MDIVDRIKILRALERMTYSEIADKSGIGRRRLENVVDRKAKVRHDDIEGIGKVFPIYKHWLAFGEELPECRQVSPMSERDRLTEISNLEDLKSRGPLHKDEEWKLYELKVNGLTPIAFVRKKQERDAKINEESTPPLNG